MASISFMKELLVNNYSADENFFKTQTVKEDTDEIKVEKIAYVLEQELIRNDELCRKNTRVVIRRKSLNDENADKQASVLKRVNYNEELINASVRHA